MEMLSPDGLGPGGVRLLQSVLDQVQQGVTIARRDADGSFPLVYANPAFLRLTGYPSSEVLGRDCRFLQGEGAMRDQPRRDALRLALQQGRAVTVTLLNFRRSGEPFWNELTVSPIHDPAGRVTHFLGLQRDVTERLQSEESLRELNQQVARRSATLKLANASLRSVAAAMAHDLRAPLAVISGFAALVRSELEAGRPEQALERLDRVAEAAERMDGMVQATLQLARAGSEPLQSTRVDLSDIAREILAGLCAQQPGRAVDLHVADGLVAAGDQALLYSVMENLLSNAWKYTAPRMPARIEVGRMVCSHGPERGPAFFVRDNGVGLDAELARADGFQPFRRYHTGSEFPGFGVGLASVRQVLARHGGSLRVRSSPGCGACFCFTLGDAGDSADALQALPRLQSAQLA